MPRIEIIVFLILLGLLFYFKLGGSVNFAGMKGKMKLLPTKWVSGLILILLAGFSIWWGWGKLNDHLEKNRVVEAQRQRVEASILFEKRKAARLIAIEAASKNPDEIVTRKISNNSWSKVLEIPAWQKFSFAVEPEGEIVYFKQVSSKLDLQKAKIFEMSFKNKADFGDESGKRFFIFKSSSSTKGRLITFLDPKF